MEQRLIDADALEKKILKRGAYKICTDDVVAMIADAPTVDAVPVDFLKKFAEGKRGYYSDFVIDAVKAYKWGAKRYCADGERITDADGESTRD